MTISLFIKHNLLMNLRLCLNDRYIRFLTFIIIILAACYGGTCGKKSGGNDTAGSSSSLTESISTPTQPTGPTALIRNATYTFSTTASASNLNHPVQYQFDWKGDGTDLSGWDWPVYKSKYYPALGTYSVRVRSRCQTDINVVSGWSSGLQITISTPSTTCTQTAGGLNHSMVVMTDGLLWAWGYNWKQTIYTGQLGVGDIFSRLTPAMVGTGCDWSYVVCGDSHTLALKTNGTLWSWGLNNRGQLGTGDANNRDMPGQVGTQTDWKQISTSQHTMAIKINGTLWGWGYNISGYLGLGDNNNRYTPAQVSTESDWKQVIAGGEFTGAVKTTGTLWFWGNNSWGQLGLGMTSSYRATPCQIGTTSDWSYISCGIEHSLAIKTNGQLWAWGMNFPGRLGVGDTNDRNTPTQVSTQTDWKQVAAQYDYTIAIKNNNTLWSWGSNGYGQLGLGDSDSFGTKDRITPTQLGTNSDWNYVGCSNWHNLAIKTNGTIWSWGYNMKGQLGLGDEGSPATDRNTPTQIGIASDW